MKHKHADVTDWFDGSIKPARAGVYERDTGNRISFSEWDGKKWLLSSGTASGAADWRLFDGYSYDYLWSANQSARWRGLTKEAK